MYKNAWCTRKVVVLLIKSIVFLTFSLPSASLDLKVPNIRSAGIEPQKLKKDEWRHVFCCPFIFIFLPPLLYYVTTGAHQ